MKYFNSHFAWLFNYNGESGLILGFASGSVPYENGRWLYSLRVFLIVCRFEILWTA